MGRRHGADIAEIAARCRASYESIREGKREAAEERAAKQKAASEAERKRIEAKAKAKRDGFYDKLQRTELAIELAEELGHPEEQIQRMYQFMMQGFHRLVLSENISPENARAFLARRKSARSEDMKKAMQYFDAYFGLRLATTGEGRLTQADEKLFETGEGIVFGSGNSIEPKAFLELRRRFQQEVERLPPEQRAQAVAGLVTKYFNSYTTEKWQQSVDNLARDFEGVLKSVQIDMDAAGGSTR